MLRTVTQRLVATSVVPRPQQASRWMSTKPMWQYQDKLPRFPLPKLEDTLTRFTESVRPLLSADEFASYKAKIESFAKNEGPQVQEHLKLLDKEAPYNWMEGFWQSMYENLRCPLPIYVNPYLLVGSDPNPVKDKSQILKTASHLAAIARFAVKVRREELSPDKIDDKNGMCMYQFTRLLGSTRIPAPNRDYVRTVSDSSHVTVLCLGQYFTLDLFNSDGSLVSEFDIARGLHAIRDAAHANRSTEANLFPLGLMTTEDRNIWAGVRSEVIQNPANKRALETLEAGMIAVCLDSVVTYHKDEFHKLALFGGAENRFFDKTLQLIINHDGEAGYNMEHTPIDGQTLFRFMFDTWNDASKQAPVDLEAVKKAPRPQVNQLKFELSANVKKAITTAQLNYHQLVGATDLAVLEFGDFGKEQIKKHKVSPDAFCQLAAHIATFRTYGRVLSTYESSSTRHYSHGRTETIRSLTNEMKDAVLKFEDPKASPAEKVEAIRKAAARHSVVAKATKVGEGWDRHLQGMYWTMLQLKERVEQYKIPPMFADPVYSNYMSNRLSTSNVGGGFAGVSSFGFGAVHAEGVGLGYMINDNSLPMTMTSYTGRAATWRDHMAQSLRDLNAFMASNAQ